MRLDTLFKNLYFRNLIGLLLLWSYGRVYSLAFYKDESDTNLMYLDLFMLFIFLWMVFHNQVLLRHVLLKGKVLMYIIALGAGLTLWLSVDSQLSDQGNLFSNALFGTTQFVLYTTVASACFFAVRYMEEKKNFYEYHILKRDAELQTLKAQLNPHFLFNSLNNIYSYNLENDTHGNDLILKLADLMRYVLDVSNRSTVTLSEELNFISNYVHFERERLGYRCQIELTISQGNEKLQIPPLIFFQLIENAFKHGASTNDPSYVKISIVQQANTITVDIENGTPDLDKRESAQIGLDNTKRRLELLYPNRHQLELQQANGIFRSHLVLECFSETVD